MIVPFPAGGPSRDLAARPVGEHAGEDPRQAWVIVDNRRRRWRLGRQCDRRHVPKPDGRHAADDAVVACGSAGGRTGCIDRPVAYEVSQFAPIARAGRSNLPAVPASRALEDAAGIPLMTPSSDPGRYPYGSSGPVRHAACRDGDVCGIDAGIELLHVPLPRRRPRADRASLGGHRAGAGLGAGHAEAAGR